MNNTPDLLINNFKNWLLKNGVKWGDFELRYDGEESGFGVYTMRSFKDNENIINIPDSLLITAGKIANMEIYRNICLENKLKPLELLIIFFSLETLKDDSKFRPYFDILPKTFSTPIITMPDLNPDDLPTQTREFWFSQQNELKEIEEKFSGIKECQSIERNHLIWAWQLVNTRCIYVENEENEILDNSDGDTIAVIPLVDMLNHSPNSNCVASHLKRISRYCITTIKGIPEGKQVYVCYGGHDNGRLWLEYGFRLNENIHNKIKINHELLFILLEKLKVKVSSGQKKAIVEAKYPFTLFASDVEPTYSMRANIRLCLMEPKLLVNWRKSLNEVDDDNDSAKEFIIKEDEILKNIFRLIVNLFLSKVEKVNENLKWLWLDNISMIEQFLNNWENKKNNLLGN
uniref:SET domain-containing protein n=1 Tax=Parastrongyloides trichosuri TaxID=131310 RepID=A0A0N4ZFH2_PARTI